MIFCFSGTGNSRYIAKKIAETLEDTIIDLNVKIEENDYSPLQTGCHVIVVVPTYAWRIPRIVSNWLLSTKLLGAKRIWFVMDCGGEIGNAAKYNRQIACEKQLQYMGTMQIIMPENYIAMFNAPQVNEAKQIVEKAVPYIENAITFIKAEKPFPIPRNNLYDRFMSGPVNPVFYRFFVKANAFLVDKRCTGCGQCAKKCPLNNIKLINGKPVWNKNCTHCMACICYCPVKAIEYGKKSKNRPRYYFEQLKIK